MKKGLISAIVVIVLILVAVLVFGGEKDGYVAGIENDVTELETELSDVEELIASDELTEDEATAAYQRVAERVASIQASVEAAQDDETLSTEQKQRLLDALVRFKEALVNFSSTLNVLEETADTEAAVSDSSRTPLYPGTSISVQIQSVIEVFEEHIDEVITDEELVELADAETYEDITGEEAPVATSTDEEEADDEEPMMEDGTITDEDMGTTSTSTDDEEATTTEN